MSAQTEYETSEFATGTIAHDTEDDIPDNLVVVEVARDDDGNLIEAQDWYVGPPIEDYLANDNPDCEPDEPVVVGVFENDLEELPGVERELGEIITVNDIPDEDLPTSVDDIHEYDLPHYAFPISRVEVASEEDVKGVRSRKRDFAQEELEDDEDEGEGDAEADGESGESEGETDSKSEETEEDADRVNLEDVADALKDAGIRVVEIDDEERTITAKKVVEEFRIHVDEGAVEATSDNPRQLDYVESAVEDVL